MPTTPHCWQCCPPCRLLPALGARDFPRSGGRLDSLAVRDRVRVVGTDLEEADHMRAPGDLVGQVDQCVAVLGQRALPALG